MVWPQTKQKNTNSTRGLAKKICRFYMETIHNRPDICIPQQRRRHGYKITVLKGSHDEDWLQAELRTVIAVLRFDFCQQWWLIGLEFSDSKSYSVTSVWLRNSRKKFCGVELFLRPAHSFHLLLPLLQCNTFLLAT